MPSLRDEDIAKVLRVSDAVERNPLDVKDSRISWETKSNILSSITMNAPQTEERKREMIAKNRQEIRDQNKEDTKQSKQ